MQPSLQPPDHPDSKSPPPPVPGTGYPANSVPNPNGAAGAAYYAAAQALDNGNGGASAAAFGVAYPYPAPPPHHQPPPPSYPYPPPHHHYPPHPPAPAFLRRRLIALAVGGLLLLLLLAAAAAFIAWLLLRPRAPFFSLTSLTLSGAAYSPTNSTLSASFGAALLAYNPDSRLSVTYFSPLASFSVVPGYPLAVASLPPLSQGPGNTTTLAFRVAVEGAYVGPGDGAAFKRGTGGTAEVDVRVAAVAVFERGDWRTRRRVMRVVCGRVPVVFRGVNSTEASFSGPARRCDVLL